MIKRNENFIIGVDHGYGYIKTSSTIMKAGIEELADMPPFKDDILVFNDRVFAVGQNRTEQYEDKTKTEDYYLLTLAAIASELRQKNLQSANNIILAVGLPYSFFSRQKDSFIRYLSRNKNISFKYEGKQYRISIKKVKVFPQGFPMISDQLDTVTDITVVDIGSRTIDILTFTNGKPVYKKCFSINNRGTLDCIENINKAYTTKYGGKLSEEMIQKLFIGQKVSLPQENQTFIKKHIRNYVLGIIQELENKDVFYNIVFCGGGATVIKLYAPEKIDESSVIKDDIFSNAKGFEKLADATT